MKMDAERHHYHHRLCDVRYRVAAWEKGALGIIRKPFQNEQVLAVVANGIKKRRKEESARPCAAP